MADNKINMVHVGEEIQTMTFAEFKAYMEGVFMGMEGKELTKAEIDIIREKMNLVVADQVQVPITLPSPPPFNPEPYNPNPWVSPPPFVPDPYPGTGNPPWDMPKVTCSVNEVACGNTNESIKFTIGDDNEQ